MTTTDPTVTEPAAGQEPERLTVEESIVEGTQRVIAAGGTTPDGRTKFKVTLWLASDNPYDTTTVADEDLTDDQSHMLRHLAAVATLAASHMDVIEAAAGLEPGLDCVLAKLLDSSFDMVLKATAAYQHFTASEKVGFRLLVSMGMDPLEAIGLILERQNMSGDFGSLISAGPGTMPGDPNGMAEEEYPDQDL